MDGSVFAERTLALYEIPIPGSDPSVEVRRVRFAREDREYLAIRLSDYPFLRFRGALPAEDGRFMLESMDFLAGGLSGWNEFTLDLIGEGFFTLRGDMASLDILSVESAGISSGKIRRKETRLTGDQALTSLHSRNQRITALTDWMHTRETVPLFSDVKSFEVYWKPILLPELVSSRKRPAGFNPKAGGRVRAEDILWNTAYTEGLFPEELRVLRDSGALLRDWEESLYWIYVQYQWDRIVELVSNQYTVIKIK